MNVTPKKRKVLFPGDRKNYGLISCSFVHWNSMGWESPEFLPYPEVKRVEIMANASAPAGCALLFAVKKNKNSKLEAVYEVIYGFTTIRIYLKDTYCTITVPVMADPEKGDLRFDAFDVHGHARIVIMGVHDLDEAEKDILRETTKAISSGQRLN